MDVGSIDPSSRRTLIAKAFELRFGASPTVWVRAPGRVDLMGSHTDYNEGFVLTMAIDRDTWIAARSRPDRLVNVHSLEATSGSSFHLDRIERDARAAWTNYIRGVAAVFQEEGYPLVGFDAMIQSTLPLASGVSSSAALEVACARLFQSLGGWEIDALKMAMLCQRAENEFVGVRCGILDQYSSVFGKEGHTLLLDCRHLASEARPLAANLAVVIGDTRAERQLTTSNYAIRRAECEEGAARLAELIPEIRSLRDATMDHLQAQEASLPPRIARRCRFVLEENARVQAMSTALEGGDRETVGQLMHASYAGAKELFEIVSPEMQHMISAMNRSPGVVGARQAGAGFGGCMVAVVDPDRVGPFIEHVAQDYRAATGARPLVYPVKAAEGAGALGG